MRPEGLSSEKIIFWPFSFDKKTEPVVKSVKFKLPTLEFLKLPTKEKTSEPLAIRGELIIKEEVFKAKYSEKYKNSRNFVSGLVNKKKLTKMEEIMINDLDFVAYEVIFPTNLKPSQQFEFLENLKPNINIVKYESNISQTELTNEFLSNKLTDYKANYMYTIDGIINIEDKVYPRLSKNPEHAFAFKMVLSDQEAETKTVNVRHRNGGQTTLSYNDLLRRLKREIESRHDLADITAIPN